MVSKHGMIDCTGHHASNPLWELHLHLDVGEVQRLYGLHRLRKAPHFCVTVLDRCSMPGIGWECTCWRMMLVGQLPVCTFGVSMALPV